MLKNAYIITNILSNIPIFHGMNKDQLETIVPLLQPMSCATNTEIIKEGTFGESMYIIRHGSVKVTRRHKKDEEISISVLYSGSYFGELSLIDNLPRSANVICIEDTEIFKLDKKDFDGLLNSNQTIANIFYNNCLKETFARFRNNLANLTFSQHDLKEKSEMLEEINKDLSFAKRVQGYFINSEYLDSGQQIHSKIRHSYIYQPCIEIGGDFLNIIKINNNAFSVIIADVEGHGITAALATGVLKSSFSIIAGQAGDNPAEFMTLMNKHFTDVLTRQLFATCYYALIDTAKERISFAKAGHPHPLFWKEGADDFIDIGCSGPCLGLIRDATYTQNEYILEKGDKILFFTDGIIEQINNNEEMYMQSRLIKIFRYLTKNGESDILPKIYDDFKEFSGDMPLIDDITMLLFEFNVDV